MFVTFEGTEGSGKSSALAAVAMALEGLGCKVVRTREPGAGELGKRVREALLHGENLTARAELFLFLADRSEHVAKIVSPALASGSVVLCDRYIDSTVAYQGHARGLPVELLRELNLYATQGLIPDLTLLFDLDPEVGLGRLSDPDRLDREPLEFHQKVREGFHIERAFDPERWVLIDASLQASEVANAAAKAVIERIR